MFEVYAYLTSEGFAITTTFAHGHSFLGVMDPFLQQIFLDISNVTSFFNQGFRMAPHVLHETILSVGYRLLRYQIIAGPLVGTKLESVAHIALTALLTTLFLQIGRRRFLQYGLVGQHLKDIVDSGLDGEDPEVVLWLLFLGGISVVSERDESWLSRRIKETARSAGLQNWASLHNSLVQFPWIGSLHDIDAERLWYSSGTGVL